MPSRSASSRSKNTSTGACPSSSAIRATVRPTRSPSAASRTPAISIVSQSTGTPWQPSLPTTSTSCAIHARSPGSRSRASVCSGPPTAARLGNSADSVVDPGRYGYESSVTSTPEAIARSTSASSSPARPRFSGKFMVACVRCSAHRARSATSTISAYAPIAPAP